jgi:hypothetical protein
MEKIKTGKSQYINELSSWSAIPFVPAQKDVGSPYICRIIPSESAIFIEWLGSEGEDYNVYLRKYESDEKFSLVCSTKACSCRIDGLATDTDYEVFVKHGDTQSLTRIARCGASIGNPICYIHPKDTAYDYSGKYLGSPSLLRHPDGYLLALMDIFGYPTEFAAAILYRSDDNGETWRFVCEICPCFWPKLFMHKGDVYVIGCSCEYGDLLIGRSRDGGMSFDPPTLLSRGPGGFNREPGTHLHAQPVYRYGGRIYATLEWGCWFTKEERGYCFEAMVMSCDENDDLLDAKNWTISEPRRFEPFAPELEGMPNTAMTIEGCLVESPQGELLNVMRFDKHHRALAYAVNTKDPAAKLEYSHLLEFPAHFCKFTMKFDKVSGYYYSVGTVVYEERKKYARNLMSLLRSRDLDHWEIVCDLHDRRDTDMNEIGFQYADFLFDGEDLIYLCRTAINGANNYHDSNYITFHRIKNFRQISNN